MISLDDATPTWKALEVRPPSIIARLEVLAKERQTVVDAVGSSLLSPNKSLSRGSPRHNKLIQLTMI